MRLIARLDIKNEHVIKGIHLEGLRKVGDPKMLAMKYCNPRVDELLIMDVVASLYGRNNLFPLIKEICKEVFIPVTVGGGIRTLDDIKQALRSGADKVAVNTAAVCNPEFVKQASKRFGSQAIVGSIEYKNNQVYIHTGREPTGKNVSDWAIMLQELGIGELLLTSIDQEGTKKGLDVFLANKIDQLLDIPVVACGGVGKPDHIRALSKSVSVACASVLHYNLYSVEDLREAC